MVYKCAAINCRSGYTKENKDSSITFHAFPLKNKDLFQTWIKRLARKDFNPTKYSRLCSLHFKPENFVVEPKDQKIRRRNKKEDLRLVKRRLQKDTCPSIFKDLTDYLQTNEPPSRPGLSNSTNRQLNEAARMEAQSETFLKTDMVENLMIFWPKLMMTYRVKNI